MYFAAVAVAFECKGLIFYLTYKRRIEFHQKEVSKYKYNIKFPSRDSKIANCATRPHVTSFVTIHQYTQYAFEYDIAYFHAAAAYVILLLSLLSICCRSAADLPPLDSVLDDIREHLHTTALYVDF